MKKQTLAIIGWKWEMWKVYNDLFTSLGYKVVLASRSTKLSIEEAASMADIVMISVPINITTKVIESIAPHLKKTTSIFDITSLKVFPIDAMLRTRCWEVVWVHPMHWPSTNINWQTYVFCRWRWTKLYDTLKEVFASKWARIVEITPRQHDDAMAIVQWLTHFTDIAFAKTLEKLWVDIPELLKLQSPAYKLKFDMMWRIMDQDANLYWNIQLANKANLKVLDTFIESSQELVKINRDWCLSKFELFFNKSKKFLWAFASIAHKQSDKIINRYFDEY